MVKTNKKSNIPSTTHKTLLLLLFLLLLFVLPLLKFTLYALLALFSEDDQNQPEYEGTIDVIIEE